MVASYLKLGQESFMPGLQMVQNFNAVNDV